MPTYEYRCPNGHEFEKFYRKISDAAGEVGCPECGALAVRQLSGGAGLVFRGSGFYLTDYGKNAHRKSVPASDAAGETKPEAKADATGDAKGEAKGGTGETKGDATSQAKPAAEAKPPAASKPARSKPAEGKPAPKKKSDG